MSAAMLITSWFMIASPFFAGGECGVAVDARCRVRTPALRIARQAARPFVKILEAAFFMSTTSGAMNSIIDVSISSACVPPASFLMRSSRWAALRRKDQ